MQAQKMSPIWYWVSPIWSDLLRFGQIWSDLVIRVTVVRACILLARNTWYPSVPPPGIATL